MIRLMEKGLLHGPMQLMHFPGQMNGTQAGKKCYISENILL